MIQDQLLGTIAFKQSTIDLMAACRLQHQVLFKKHTHTHTHTHNITVMLMFHKNYASISQAVHTLNFIYLFSR